MKLYMVQRRSAPGRWDDMMQTEDESAAYSRAEQLGENGRVVELNSATDFDRNFNKLLITGAAGIGLAVLAFWLSGNVWSLILAVIVPVVGSVWYWVDRRRSRSRTRE